MYVYFTLLQRKCILKDLYKSQHSYSSYMLLKRTSFLGAWHSLVISKYTVTNSPSHHILRKFAGFLHRFQLPIQNCLTLLFPEQCIKHSDKCHSLSSCRWDKILDSLWNESHHTRDNTSQPDNKDSGIKPDIKKVI